MATNFNQSSNEFIAALDSEIERLQQMRQQIADVLGADGGANRPVRRGMSAEGRQRIAEAQKARWAKQKGAAKPRTASKTAAQTATKAPAKGSGKKAPAKKAETKAPAKKVSAKKAAAKKVAATKVPAKTAPRKQAAAITQEA